MIKTTEYKDEKSGECIGKKTSRIEIFNEEGYLFWSNKFFRKQFADINLSEHIGTGEDFRRVHILAEKIYKTTNTISIRVNTRKVRPADIDDISKLVGLNIRRTKEFLNRMAEKHIIALRTDKVGDIVSQKYVMNPIFFFSSKRLSADLYFLFQESLDQYLSPKTVQEFHAIGSMEEDKKCLEQTLKQRVLNDNPLKMKLKTVLDKNKTTKNSM